MFWAPTCVDSVLGSTLKEEDLTSFEFSQTSTSYSLGVEFSFFLFFFSWRTQEVKLKTHQLVAALKITFPLKQGGFIAVSQGCVHAKGIIKATEAPCSTRRNHHSNGEQICSEMDNENCHGTR